ncbi:hypothetical protein GCM10022265_03650 [Marinobacter xestospongiae]
MLHGHKQSGIVTLVESRSGYLLVDLLRHYYPKGTNFAKVSQQALNRVVDELNNRPRKRLGYRTPAEVFWGEYSGALGTSGTALAVCLQGLRFPPEVLCCGFSVDVEGKKKPLG